MVAFRELLAYCTVGAGNGASTSGGRARRHEA